MTVISIFVFRCGSIRKQSSVLSLIKLNITYWWAQVIIIIKKIDTGTSRHLYINGACYARHKFEKFTWKNKTTTHATTLFIEYVYNPVSTVLESLVEWVVESSESTINQSITISRKKNIFIFIKYSETLKKI